MLLILKNFHEFGYFWKRLITIIYFWRSKNDKFQSIKIQSVHLLQCIEQKKLNENVVYLWKTTEIRGMFQMQHFQQFCMLKTKRIHSWKLLDILSTIVIQISEFKYTSNGVLFLNDFEWIPKTLVYFFYTTLSKFTKLLSNFSTQFCMNSKKIRETSLHTFE